MNLKKYRHRNNLEKFLAKFFEATSERVLIFVKLLGLSLVAVTQIHFSIDFVFLRKFYFKEVRWMTPLAEDFHLFVFNGITPNITFDMSRHFYHRSCTLFTPRQLITTNSKACYYLLTKNIIIII